MGRPKGSKNIKKEDVLKVAEKYKFKSDFQSGNKAEYKHASRNGYLDEACKHMSKRKPIKSKYTTEVCREAASKYETRNDFKTKDPNTYNGCRNNSEVNFDEICDHMESSKLPGGTWTIAVARKEAGKYQTRARFKKGNPYAYEFLRKLGQLDDACTHMKELMKPGGYWTFERCQEEASKYETASEFREGSTVAHQTASEKGWLEEVTSHMVRLKSLGEKKIEAYLTDNRIEFEAQFTDEFIKKQRALRFDFYLPNQNILVEFDGEQHFYPSFKGVSGLEIGANGLGDNHLRDMVKNKLSLVRGYRLLRIPYWHLKTLTSLLDRLLEDPPDFAAGHPYYAGNDLRFRKNGVDVLALGGCPLKFHELGWPTGPEGKDLSPEAFLLYSHGLATIDFEVSDPGTYPFKKYRPNNECI